MEYSNVKAGRKIMDSSGQGFPHWLSATWGGPGQNVTFQACWFFSFFFFGIKKNFFIEI